MNLGKAIKVIRTQKNMSQTDLSALSYISVSYLSLLERNKRDPNLSTVKQIADALDVPLVILMFLAAEGDEISTIGEELAERLSYTLFKIIQ